MNCQLYNAVHVYGYKEMKGFPDKKIQIFVLCFT